MALSFPLTTLVTAGRFAGGHLRPVYRQERSTTAGGEVRGKDLGPTLWAGSFQTRVHTIDEIRQVEAQLAALDGVIRTFEGCDVRFQRPAAAASDFDDTGVTISGTPTASALALAGLPAGFTMTVGDHLAFTYGTSRALHQCVETVTANGSGVTPAFEVRPYIRPGASAGAAVSLVRPAAVFALDPGGVSEPEQVQPRHYRLSFTAMQVID